MGPNRPLGLPDKLQLLPLLGELGQLVGQGGAPGLGTGRVGGDMEAGRETGRETGRFGIRHGGKYGRQRT